MIARVGARPDPVAGAVPVKHLLCYATIRQQRHGVALESARIAVATFSMGSVMVDVFAVYRRRMDRHRLFASPWYTEAPPLPK